MREYNDGKRLVACRDARIVQARANARLDLVVLGGRLFARLPPIGNGVGKIMKHEIPKLGPRERATRCLLVPELLLGAFQHVRPEQWTKEDARGIDAGLPQAVLQVRCYLLGELPV